VPRGVTYPSLAKEYDLLLRLILVVIVLVLVFRSVRGGVINIHFWSSCVFVSYNDPRIDVTCKVRDGKYGAIRGKLYMVDGTFIRPVFSCEGCHLDVLTRHTLQARDLGKRAGLVVWILCSDNPNKPDFVSSGDSRKPFAVCCQANISRSFNVWHLDLADS
jgi:hypothetical protein